MYTYLANLPAPVLHLCASHSWELLYSPPDRSKVTTHKRVYGVYSTCMYVCCMVVCTFTKILCHVYALWQVCVWKARTYCCAATQQRQNMPHMHNTLSCASIASRLAIWAVRCCVMLCLAGAGGFETIEYCIYCESKDRAQTNVDDATYVSLTKQFT